jgi:hypothetical protein
MPLIGARAPSVAARLLSDHDVLLEAGRRGGEHGAQLLTKQLHDRDHSDGDQRQEETVFGDGQTIFILKKLGDALHGESPTSGVRSGAQTVFSGRDLKHAPCRRIAEKGTSCQSRNANMAHRTRPMRHVGVAMKVFIRR